MDTVDKDERILYKCDHTKNIECSKSGCYYVATLGLCKLTTQPEYSIDGVAYSLNDLEREERLKNS